MNWLTELQRRRVLPLLGAYLGSAWVLVEFCNFVAERYHLSEAWVDALLALALSLLPGLLLFAWNHGAPGPDPWTRLERYLLSANVVAGLSVAALVMSDRPLAAMAETIERTGEDGRTYTSAVARQEFRRRLLLFPLDHAAGDPQLRAAAFGLPELLQTSLHGDPYFEADTILDQFGVLEQLRRSGSSDGSGAPLPLQRRIAGLQHFDYLLRGQLRASGQRWQAILQLEAVAPPASVLQVELQADSLTALADAAHVRLSAALAKAIAAPPASAAAPLAEQYGSDEAALLALFQATLANIVDNDQAAARQWIDRAIASDPHSARALLRSAMIHVVSGQQQQAVSDLGLALEQDWRLDDRSRFKARAMRYGLLQQHRQREAVLRLWTELYPSSLEARLLLAATLLWSGQDIDGAVLVYRQILEMAPGLSWIHAILADLHVARGEQALAMAQASQYVQAEPDRARGQVLLARLHLHAGELEQARAPLERAALLEPELVGPILLEAELEARLGRVEAADAAIARALAGVRQPSQAFEVHCRHAGLLEFQQRWQAALAQADQCAETGRSLVAPLQWVMDVRLPFSGLRTRLDGLAPTLAAIDADLAGFDQGFRDIGCYGRMLAALEGGDAARARTELALLGQVLARSNRPDLEFFVAYGRGRLALLEGDPAAAVQGLAEARQLFDSSIHAGKGAERFFDLQVGSVVLELQARLAARQFDGAAELLQASLRRYPGSPALQTVAAELQLALGDAAAARASLARASALWQHADAAAIPRERLERLRQALAQ